MRDVDLSDVPPMLRAQVRRRVRAIRQYLSPTKPKAHTARYFAERLEMSEARFRATVAAWRKYRKASALPGASYTKRSSDTLEPDIASLVDQVREEAVPGTSFSDIMRKVRQRCAELSLPPPRRMVVARHLAEQSGKEPEARPRRPRSSLSAPPPRYNGPPLLLVDHLDLDLAVFDPEESAATANLTLAVLLPEQAVVAHIVSTGYPTAQRAAQVLLKALGCETLGTPARAVTYQTGVEPDWIAFNRALRDADIRISETGSEALIDVRAFLRNELTRLLSAQAASPGPEARISLGQATSRISAAIERYTHQFRTPETGLSIPPFAIMHRPKTAAARGRLAVIAKQRIGPIRTRSPGSRASTNSK